MGVPAEAVEVDLPHHPGKIAIEQPCRVAILERLVVADGVRSTLGRKLGREWHRDTAYGVAARAYVDSGKHDDPWISSHLELRGADHELLSGYGWVFPLGGGQVNIGVGTLATARRPADVALRPLLGVYADLTNAYTPSLGLMGHESLIMQQSDSGEIVLPASIRPR